MRNTFTQGDYVCLLYETDEEQIRATAEFLSEGFSKDERCIYVDASYQHLARVNRALAWHGVDVDVLMQRGAYIEGISDRMHLDEGGFDAKRLLLFLNAAVEAALDAGFAGLRFCTDMSWLLNHPPGGDQIVEFEPVAAVFFQHARAVGMAQYDLRRLPEEIIARTLAMHRLVMVKGALKDNPFYADAWPADVAQRSGRGVQRMLRELRRRPARAVGGPE